MSSMKVIFAIFRRTLLNFWGPKGHVLGYSGVSEHRLPEIVSIPYVQLLFALFIPAVATRVSGVDSAQH